MKTLQALEVRLNALETEIKEAERRLPAHSIKPGTMMMLLELEVAIFHPRRTPCTPAAVNGALALKPSGYDPAGRLKAS